MCGSPVTCPYGHALGAGQVLLGWRACQCPGAQHGGHRTWTCQRCLHAGVGNEAATIYITRQHERDPDQRFGTDLSHLITPATIPSSERVLRVRERVRAVARWFGRRFGLGRRALDR